MLQLDPKTARLGEINGTNYLMLDEPTTGKTYARVAEFLPSFRDPHSIAKKEELLALNPEFFDYDPPATRGYYVDVETLKPKAA